MCMSTVICFLFMGVIAGARRHRFDDFEFDDVLAKQAFYLSAAAYSDEPQLCLDRKFDDMELVQVFKAKCDLMGSQCWAFLAVSETMKTIALSFRGTRSRAQLIVEFMETMSFAKVKFAPGGAVERYFYKAFHSLWPNISAKLDELQANYADYKLLVTGHSLGAALAALGSSAAVFNSTYWSPSTATLVTFGEPRVGNYEFARAHDRLLPRTWRVVHRYDCVAHLPYCYEKLWSRSCSSVYDHSPYHHGTEIWFQSVMDGSEPPKICRGLPIDEDNSCSNGQYIHFTANDHFFYYEYHVSDYGEAGCIDIPPPATERLQKAVLKYLPTLMTLITAIVAPLIS